MERLDRVKQKLKKFDNTDTACKTSNSGNKPKQTQLSHSGAKLKQTPTSQVPSNIRHQLTGSGVKLQQTPLVISCAKQTPPKYRGTMQTPQSPVVA